MTEAGRLAGRVAVFIHIPKNAGVTLSKAFKVQKYRNRRRLIQGAEYSGIITFGHEFLPPLQARGLAPKDAFTFAFCRNPYDRAVSMWAFNNKRNGLDLTFTEFCRGLNDWVWRIRYPQVKWLEGVDLNFLGRFETLQTDFGILCDMLDFQRQRPLPHMNKSEHGSCRDHYTDETMGIVRAHYARDFERFGYAVDHLPDG